ncbi:MAG: Brp/Blh family beta-carotene 15,15'-dioxygenase [Bacteroidota bacterium]
MFIRLIVGLLASAFLIAAYLGLPLEEIQAYLFLLILVTVGIPHGALDHKIVFTNESYRKRDKIKFYVTYVILMLVTGLCWFINAQWSFILFLFISAFHFGQSQFYYVNLKGILAGLLYFSWGVVLLSSIIWLNLGECIDFFLSLPQLKAETFITPTIIGSSVVVSFILFAGVVSYALIKRKMSLKALCYELLSLFIIIGLAAKTTAVMAFIIYFGLWHSLISLSLEYKHLRGKNANYNLWAFTKELLPHSTIAILFMAVFYWYSFRYDWAISPYMLFIILISIITVPHLFVMGRMYNSFRLPS